MKMCSKPDYLVNFSSNWSDRILQNQLSLQVILWKWRDSRHYAPTLFVRPHISHWGSRVLRTPGQGRAGGYWQTPSWIFELEGARSRYFRQFQHWSNCHRINLNIKLTSRNHRRTRAKHRKDKKGHGWTKLERGSGLHMDKFVKSVGPTFFKFTVFQFIHQNFINTAGKSFSVVMWPWFWKWKTLGLPIWRVELTISKIKQNYLK